MPGQDQARVHHAGGADGQLIDIAIPRAEDNPVATSLDRWRPRQGVFPFRTAPEVLFDFYLPNKGIVIYHVDDNTQQQQ